MPSRNVGRRRRQPSGDEEVVAVTESHPDLLRLNTPTAIRRQRQAAARGGSAAKTFERWANATAPETQPTSSTRSRSAKKQGRSARMPPSLGKMSPGARESPSGPVGVRSGTRGSSRGKQGIAGPSLRTTARQKRGQAPPPLPSDIDIGIGSATRHNGTTQRASRSPPSLLQKKTSFGAPKLATTDRVAARPGVSKGKKPAEYYQKLAADARAIRLAAAQQPAAGDEASPGRSDRRRGGQPGNAGKGSPASGSRPVTPASEGDISPPPEPSLEELALSGAPPSPMPGPRSGFAGGNSSASSQASSRSRGSRRTGAQSSRLPPSMMSPLTTAEGRIMKTIASGRSMLQAQPGLKGLKRGASRRDVAAAMAEEERASRRSAWEQVIGPLPAPAAMAEAEEKLKRATEMPSWHKAEAGSDFFEQRAKHDAADRAQRAMQRTASGRETLRARRARAAAARAKSIPRGGERPPSGASEQSGSPEGRSSSAARGRRGGRRRGGAARGRSGRGELEEAEGGAGVGPPVLRASNSFRSADRWASLYGDEATMRTKQAVKEAQLAAERADREAAEAEGGEGAAAEGAVPPGGGAGGNSSKEGGEEGNAEAEAERQGRQSRSSPEAPPSVDDDAEVEPEDGGPDPSAASPGQEQDEPQPQRRMSLGPYRKLARDLERAMQLVRQEHESALGQEETLKQEREGVEQERAAAEQRKEELLQAAQDVNHEADSAEASILPGGSINMRKEAATKELRRLQEALQAAKTQRDEQREASKRRISEIEADIGMEGLKADQREHRLLQVEEEATRHLDRARDQVSLAHEEAGLIQDQRDEIELMKQSLQIADRNMSDLRRVVQRAKVLASANERTAAGQLAAEQSRLEATSTSLRSVQGKCSVLQRELAQVHEETAELTQQLSKERRQLLKLQEQATQAVLRDAAAISEAAKQSARLKRLEVARKAAQGAADVGKPGSS